MNIIERGKVFLQQLQELAKRTAWDWKRCPHCGSQLTIKNGGYARHPWVSRGASASGCSGICAMRVLSLIHI